VEQVEFRITRKLSRKRRPGDRKCFGRFPRQETISSPKITQGRVAHSELSFVITREPLRCRRLSLREICDVISVSAGMRGLQILLAPEDYIRAAKARVVAIILQLGALAPRLAGVLRSGPEGPFGEAEQLWTFPLDPKLPRNPTSTWVASD
jgi:hypothetical protein